MNKYIIGLLLAVITLTSCRGQNCSTLPVKLGGYDEAISKVKATVFTIHETVNTSASSWIRNVHYYSCNGQTGYFIYKTDSKEYIHANVPYDVWKGFKTSDSFGSYYDKYIRNKYHYVPE